MNALSEWDIGILDGIADHLSCSFLEVVSAGLGWLSEIGFVWILLALILMIRPKTRKAGCSMILSLLIGVILASVVLKPLIARIRPWVYVEMYHPEHAPIVMSSLAYVPTDFSFPSGHALASLDASVALLLWDRKWGIPALCFGLLTAFSRLYLYFHYPSDVLVSMLLGVLIAFLAVALVKKFYDPVETWLRSVWSRRKKKKTE